MSRFDEGNSTVRWIPGFAREWFGLTGEAPKSRRSEARYDARAADANSLLPLGLRRWLGLTFEQAEGSAPVSTPVARAAESGGTRYAPSASGNFATTGSYTPSSSRVESSAVGSDRRTPVSGIGDLQPLDYLLKSYARGALPPQGLESFTRQVRSTSEDVVGMYSKYIKFETEGLLKLAGGLLSSMVDLLPGERSASAAAPMRRIKVTAADEQGNGNGHADTEAAK